MKAISGKEFAKLLERKGWKLKRVKGIAGIDESEL